jgi:hypothetical protein
VFRKGEVRFDIEHELKEFVALFHKLSRDQQSPSLKCLRRGNETFVQPYRIFLRLFARQPSSGRHAGKDAVRVVEVTV